MLHVLLNCRDMLLFIIVVMAQSQKITGRIIEEEHKKEDGVTLPHHSLLEEPTPPSEDCFIDFYDQQGVNIKVHQAAKKTLTVNWDKSIFLSMPECCYEVSNRLGETMMIRTHHNIKPNKGPWWGGLGISVTTCPPNEIKVWSLIRFFVIGFLIVATIMYSVNKAKELILRA